MRLTKFDLHFTLGRWVDEIMELRARRVSRSWFYGSVFRKKQMSMYFVVVTERGGYDIAGIPVVLSKRVPQHATSSTGTPN